MTATKQNLCLTIGDAYRTHMPTSRRCYIMLLVVRSFAVTSLDASLAAAFPLLSPLSDHWSQLISNANSDLRSLHIYTYVSKDMNVMAWCTGKQRSVQRDDIKGLAVWAQRSARCTRNCNSVIQDSLNFFNFYFKFFYLFWEYIKLSRVRTWFEEIIAEHEKRWCNRNESVLNLSKYQRSLFEHQGFKT